MANAYEYAFNILSIKFENKENYRHSHIQNIYQNSLPLHEISHKPVCLNLHTHTHMYVRTHTHTHIILK